MPTHKKPTQEELKALEETAIAEAEKLKDESVKDEETEKKESVENPDDEPKEDAEVSEEEASEEEVSEEEVSQEELEESQAEPSEEEKEALKKRLADEKKKSSASARENQKIYAKNRVINEALVEADDIPEPTEEELIKEFPDWDMMGDTERIFAKETVISRNWRKVISEAKEQATKIEKWNESVEVFVEDPETLINNPDLEGKTEEFKAFATEEVNNSVPFKILVSAFLHEYTVKKPTNKGRMFERGKGGSKEKFETSDGSITLEEARKLRETDYSKYKEYLTAGKIKSDL